MPWLAVTVCAGLMVFVVLAYRRQWRWTGLPATPGATTNAGHRPAKTLWDWLQLLGIPLALAVLAVLFNTSQNGRDQRREDRRAAQQRTATVDAEREGTLRTYLAQMSDLMLNRGLVHSRHRADVRDVARTITLTAIRRLDGARRGLVLRFLAEAGLLQHARSPTPVDVSSATFAHARLDGADLRGVRLDRTNLAGANLPRVFLGGPVVYLGAGRFRRTRSGATLLNANLGGANLTRANLSGANLRGTNLTSANLSGAILYGADLRGATLTGANLTAAELIGTELFAATLTGAQLIRANLRGAHLRGAELRGANFRGADVSDADLRGAHVDLAGSRGEPRHRP